MNELTTITRIYEHHAAAFTGLTKRQRAAVLNAMGACYQQGQQSRPDYNMPPTLDGDTSETIRKARIFEDAMPVPDGPGNIADWCDKVYAQLQGVDA